MLLQTQTTIGHPTVSHFFDPPFFFLLLLENYTFFLLASALNY